ncbi:hypothetical protein F4781DRAFT_380112 [Annulohypoxylon bovei var. microspora]|nr:hypothetical protein F4781DRAFT_380112 [Annulohypoxylon bovei var. microspora]
MKMRSTSRTSSMLKIFILFLGIPSGFVWKITKHEKYFLVYLQLLPLIPGLFVVIST